MTEKLSPEDQSSFLIQQFGGNKAFARKCVVQILKATQKSRISVGGNTFSGSTSKRIITLDPYWKEVDKILRR